MTTTPTISRTEATVQGSRGVLPAVPQPVRTSRGSNFEAYSWYYFRVSGVLILLLALTHLAIMHLINNVDVIDYKFVAARWASPFWRIFDWLLLTLTVTHGANGVRVAINDYVRRRGWQLVAHSVNWVLMILILMIGSVIIMYFQPVATR